VTGSSQERHHGNASAARVGGFEFTTVEVAGD
jgi:hypothetical protein